MATKPSEFGFVECADLVNEQKYGAELFSERSANSSIQIARQLLQIGTALEETLKLAIGDDWDSHVPKFEDERNPNSTTKNSKKPDTTGPRAGTRPQIIQSLGMRVNRPRAMR